MDRKCYKECYDVRTTEVQPESPTLEADEADMDEVNVMTQVVQRVSANGLQLPKELIEQWGTKEGQEVIIELQRSFIRIVPAEVDVSEIADRAATYVLDYVGDATAVGQPEQVGEQWRVPVLLSYRPKQLGVLTYSRRGELLPEESDSPKTMRERSRED